MKQRNNSKTNVSNSLYFTLLLFEPGHFHHTVTNKTDSIFRLHQLKRIFFYDFVCVSEKINFIHRIPTIKILINGARKLSMSYEIQSRIYNPIKYVR